MRVKYISMKGNKQIIKALALLITACLVLAGCSTDPDTESGGQTSSNLSDSMQSSVPSKSDEAESADSQSEQSLKEIPSSYLNSAAQQGQVVRLDYTTSTYDNNN